MLNLTNIGRYNSRRSNKPRFDRNNYIKADKLRIIDHEGENLGVKTKEEGIKLAKQQGLDLVLVNPAGNPPVAKIIDWSKFKYELSKKDKGGKSSSGQSEIRVTAHIQEHDLKHKLAKVKELIEDGDKVKFTIRYRRGATKELMQDLMQKVLDRVGEYAKQESKIKHEGRNLAVYLISD